MTGADLDELARLVAASDARESEDSLAHARASIAMRDAALELIDLAREALAARETPSGPRVPDAPGWWWLTVPGMEARPRRVIEIIMTDGRIVLADEKTLSDVDAVARFLGGEWGGRCVPPRGER